MVEAGDKVGLAGGDASDSKLPVLDRPRRHQIAETVLWSLFRKSSLNSCKIEGWRVTTYGSAAPP